MSDHYEWFDPMDGRKARLDAKAIEVVIRRKPQTMRYPPSMSNVEIEACVDRICGCGGAYDCQCVSVFNKAQGDAWYRYNRERYQ